MGSLFLARAGPEGGTRRRRSAGGELGGASRALAGRWERAPADALRTCVGEAHRDPRVPIYTDPPYLRSTRSEDYYSHETDDADHVRLLEALLAHPGPVVLSGHDSPFYRDALGGWARAELLGRRQGRKREQEHYGSTEIVWRNPAASGHAGDEMRPLVP